ncbi:hypothetical protein EON63_23490, partial [archaeon]
SPPFFLALEEKLSLEGQDIFAISNGHGFIASATAKRYAFSYYLAHGTMDLIVQKKKGERDQVWRVHLIPYTIQHLPYTLHPTPYTLRSTPYTIFQGMDLPNTVLKKTPMPKNWRLVQSHRHTPIYYSVEDFVCGTVLDIYGRYFLLCVCDSYTQKMYGQIGIHQREVRMIEEEVEKIVQPVPEAGDGFLAIGSHEDTLGKLIFYIHMTTIQHYNMLTHVHLLYLLVATVYGMPKPRKNVAKIYKNTNRYTHPYQTYTHTHIHTHIHAHRLLRAKAKLMTDHPIEGSRVFLLTFFLEDDSLQVCLHHIQCAVL